MKGFKISTLLLLASAISIAGLAQKPRRTKPKRPPIGVGQGYNVYPQTLMVRGIVSQVEYAPPACGELIFAATFEIKLDRTLKGYPHPFVYVVVPCLYRPEGEERFLNRRVEIKVTKQDGKRRPCFFDIWTSMIVARGVPFYCAHREDLLQANARKTTATHVETAEYDGGWRGEIRIH